MRKQKRAVVPKIDSTLALPRIDAGRRCAWTFARRAYFPPLKLSPRRAP